MNKKHYFLIIISTLLIAVLGTAFTGISQADVAAPAEVKAFSFVMEFGGVVEEDLQRYAHTLQDQGYSEAEIQQELAHLRPALETSKYDPIETRTFSVEVEFGDIDAYVRALREQGVSEETIQALDAEVQDKRQSLSDGVVNARGCKIRTDGAEARNIYGQLLYRYSSSTYWCYNGNTITSLDTWESYSTYLGWQFRGSTKSQSGGVGQWSYILHRYATMYNPYLGLYGYPDTHQGVYGDGSSWGYANP
ncbi:MAG: hypothetical protein R6U51_03230 [Anaerolineales bacterium]